MGEIRRRGEIWWVRYYREGRRHEESSRSRKKGDAERLLKLREGDVARGVPVTPKIGQLRFDEAAEDMFLDYRVNKKPTLADVECRVRKHLRPVFGGRRMASITTPPEFGESWTESRHSNSRGTPPKPAPSTLMNATLLSFCHGT